MTILKHRHRPDEALIPCATAQTASVVRPRAVDAPRPARRSGVSADVLRELRAADVPLSSTAIRDAHDRGSWLPASVGIRRTPLTATPPLPGRDLIERLAVVSAAMHDDYARHLDTLAVLDGISAAIADGADAHTVRMALAPIAAELADLAPFAMLNGEVA